jgi:hypothetical protein
MTALAYVHPSEEAISILRGLDPAAVVESPIGVVYLVHLDRPLILSGYKFGHYLGKAGPGRLQARMVDHRLGRGSKFLRLAAHQGITWHLARVWPATKREYQQLMINGLAREERRIKAMGGASRSCPSCGIVPRAERQKFRGPDGRYVNPGSTSWHRSS